MFRLILNQIRHYFLLVACGLLVAAGVFVRSQIGWESISAGASGFDSIGPSATVVYDVRKPETGDYQLGEVVVFSDLIRPDQRLLGRVAGKPGDVVEIRGGKLYRNKVEIAKGLKDPSSPDFPAIRVPRDTLFLLGDYTGGRMDSRNFGPVPVYAVLGKARFIE